MIAQTRWSLVLIATIAGFVASANIGKVSPVLPLIQQNLQLSLSQLGWIVSAYSLLAMLLCLPMAIAGARFGNYRMALLALLLMGGGGLISANADSLTILLSGRITEGFGFVMIAVAAPALIARAVLPQDRAIAMTIWSLWLPVGVSAMLLLSPILVAWSGWRLVWTVTGCFALVWLVVLGLSFLNVGRSGDRQPGMTAQELRGLFHRDSWLLAFSLSCFSGLYTVGVAFSPTIWHDMQQISLATGSLLLVFAMVGTMAGNLAGGYLIKRGYPVNRLLVFCFVIPACIGGIALLEGLPFWLQYLCFFVFATSTGMVPSAIFAVAPAYTQKPVQIAPAIAFVFQGTTMGQVLGPIIFSRFIEYHDQNWSWGLVYYVGLACLGGCLMYLIRPPGTTREATSATTA